MGFIQSPLVNKKKLYIYVKFLVGTLVLIREALRHHMTLVGYQLKKVFIREILRQTIFN